MITTDLRCFNYNFNYNLKETQNAMQWDAELVGVGL